MRQITASLSLVACLLVASNPAQAAESDQVVGTWKLVSFVLDGNQLKVLTPWRTMPNWADKGETRSIITFTKAK